ncbi:TPA: hypothetical protein ACWX1I_003126 [Elizabethkingia anophelis]
MKLKYYLSLLLFLTFILLGYILFPNQSVNDNYEKTFDLPLIEQSNTASATGNATEYLRINQKFLTLALQKKYKDGEALCYILSAKLKMNTGHFKEAFLFLSKAEKLLINSKNNIHLAMLNNEFSILNSFMQTTDEALNYSNKAITYMARDKSSILKKSTLSEVYINRANINILNDSSIVYYHKAKNILPPDDITIYSYIANRHLLNNKTDSAKVYILQVLSILNKEKNSSGTEHSFVYNTLSAYFTQIKEYNQAEKYGQIALNLIHKERETIGYFTQYVYLQLAEVYKSSGNRSQEALYRNLYNKEVHQKTSELMAATSLMLKKRTADIKNSDNKAKNKEALFIILMSVIGLIICLLAYKIIQSLQLKKRKLQAKTDKIKKEAAKQMYDKVLLLAKKNDSSFLVNFQELYPEYIANILNINPDLESSELAFCALLKLNFSSREIANYTFIQIASVQQRKRRLRKRLNIPSDMDVYDFLSRL